MEIVTFPHAQPAHLRAWKVREGGYVLRGQVILEFMHDEAIQGVQRMRAPAEGVVTKTFVKKGDSLTLGTELLQIEECTHETIIADLCAVCGLDLQKMEIVEKTGSHASLIHTAPQLRISMQEAQLISKTEEERLFQERKIQLLVDLDQTLLHTTNELIPNNIRDVLHFQLPTDPNNLSGSLIWYHTRLRPGLRGFLERMSKLFQLHICTFGARNYAHAIAHHLDPDGKYFSMRILSRDECFSQNSKMAHLKDLFPNGDHAVCIIDDRDDVWNFTPNLIQVKPYHFFAKTGDINAPPGLSKKDNDNKTGFDFSGGIPKPIGKDPSEATQAGQAAEDTAVDPGSQGKPVDVKTDLSNDLLLTDDDSDTEEERAADGGSESSSDGEITEVSTPKPGVPHYFDDEESTQDTLNSKAEDGNENISSQAKSDLKSTSTTESAAVESESEPVQLKSDVETEATVKPDLPVVSTVAPSDNTNPKVDNEQTEVTNSVEVDSQPKETVASSVAQFPVKDGYLDLEDPDDYLLYLEDVLKRVHAAYFKLYDELKEKNEAKLPDVKEIVPFVRKQVLKDCSIVFSGVIPMEAQLKKSRAYIVARSMGACVSDKIIPPLKPGSASTSKDALPTTHVVAARLGTAKVNEARRYKGIHVVTPNWLWCAAERWERPDEKIFALCKKSAVKRQPPNHCTVKGEAISGVNDDPDDAVFGVEGSSTAEGGYNNGELPAGSRRVRTLSGRFMDTINPLLSFSMDEIESMGHEVDDICAESGSSSSSSDEEKSAPREKILRRKQSRNSISSPQHIGSLISDTINVGKDSSGDSSDDEDSTMMESSQDCLSALARKRRRDMLPKTETETEEEETLITKFRRGEPLPSDVDYLNLTNQSTDDDANEEVDQENEWMAQELERELLGGNDSSQDQDQSRDGY